jgi:serine/threonine-protein kinase RsbW
MGAQTLKVPARLKSIRRVAGAVAGAATEAGFDDRTSYACQLATSEACENIIVHGYGHEGDETIEVRVASEPGRLEIELIDSAPPFDPSEPKPAAPDPPLDPPIGGLGLHIVHRVMDEVSYRRRGGKNHLLLTKALPKAGD